MENVPKRRQRTELVERLNGGKLRIERRNGSPNLYATAFLQGKNVVKSTGEDTPDAARKVAYNWFLEQLERIRKGEHLHGRRFADSAEAFFKHADRVKQVGEGQRRNYRQKWTLLQGHFDGVALTDIDTDWLEALRDKRKASVEIIDAKGRRRARPKPISNATLKKDFDFIRLVMRFAKEREKILSALPQFPSFKGRVWKVKNQMRPFLSDKYWKNVRQRAKDRTNEEGLNPRTRRQRQELYCFLMLCVGAALRVDEAHSLRWKDCNLMTLDDEDQTEVVQMWVYGKHADTLEDREQAWAMYDGVIGFKLLQSLRTDAKPDDFLFLEKHRDGMRLLLEDSDVREDEISRLTRDSKSLRQTGISMRLELGRNPSYNDIAKWARTTPGQIGKFYDQTHPQESVKRIAGFRDRPHVPKPTTKKKRKQKAESAATLKQLQDALKEQTDDQDRNERER